MTRALSGLSDEMQNAKCEMRNAPSNFERPYWANYLQWWHSVMIVTGVGDDDDIGSASDGFTLPVFGIDVESSLTDFCRYVVVVVKIYPVDNGNRGLQEWHRA